MSWTLTAALLAGCGDEEPSEPTPSASAKLEPPAATAADSGEPSKEADSGEPSKEADSREPAKDGEREGRDQGDRQPGHGRPTCAGAEGAPERERGCGPPEESGPNVPSLPEATSPGKHEPAPAPDETGVTGHEPDKPTVPAEQPHYSQAEVACDAAAETPEEKADCFD